jgi:hypothetical protein
MELVFNWMVLLLSLGGIAIIALVCYVDLIRSTARVSDMTPTSADQPLVRHEAGSAKVSGGPSLEMSYCRDGIVHHVQLIPAGQPGYIGTESYAGFGAGMPVRCAEVVFNNQAFTCTNLDWQTQLVVRNESGEDTDIQMGQTELISNGTELHLQGGWIIQCRVFEAPKV